MLVEMDVVIFLKSNDTLEGCAQRVFGAINTPYHAGTPDEDGVETFEGSGLGFEAMLYANSGDVLDPEFESYRYGLEITSQFWDIELDGLDIEGPLSEYFARLLAFELDMETATEMLVEATEESEIFEIRAFRRNPQYRLDQPPTAPKVFVIETRTVEEAFDDDDENEEWSDIDDEDKEGDEDEDEDEEGENPR